MPLFDKEVLLFGIFFCLLVFQVALGVQLIFVWFMNSAHLSWIHSTRRWLNWHLCLLSGIFVQF